MFRCLRWRQKYWRTSCDLNRAKWSLICARYWHVLNELIQSHHFQMRLFITIIVFDQVPLTPPATRLMLSCTVPQIHCESQGTRFSRDCWGSSVQWSSHTLNRRSVWEQIRSDLSSWMNDGSSKRVIYCTDVCMLYCWFHSLQSDLHTHQHKTHLTRNKSTDRKSVV